MQRVWISKTEDALDREVAAALKWLDWESIVAKDARVSIKPNLTYPIHKPGVTTSPRMLEAVIRLFNSRTRNINIVEADGGSYAWPADEAFKGHGIDAMCDRYGARAVNLTNYPRENVETEIAGRRVSIEMSRLLTRETDVFITMPVPKLHMMTRVSLGLKNQWGCIPDVKRLRNHADFAHKVLAINQILKPRFAIFDGTWFLDRSGPLEGDPVRKDLLIASRDAGSGSMVCCALMGIDPFSVPHLRLAIREGMMPATINAVTTNTPIDTFVGSPFILRRTWFQLLTLGIFHSRLATIALYDSPLARPAHELLYLFKGRPADFSPKW
jgi:uncharacterized protein (DUF362 family)